MLQKIQWPQAIVVSVVILVAGALSYKGVPIPAWCAGMVALLTPGVWTMFQGGSDGPPKLPPIAVLLLCAGCQGGVPPNVVQAGVATIETAICIVNVYSKDKAAGQSDGAAVADCVQQCATDAATIARVLDANHAAMMRERMLTCTDGGS